MNPILDRKSFVADPEAHKMSDGRLYIYGSLDVSGKKDYCSQQYKVFSTDDPKLEKWTDHGISFSNVKGKEQVSWRRCFNLYAPEPLKRMENIIYSFAAPLDMRAWQLQKSRKVPLVMQRN